jgi:hypothetical protein
MMGRLQALALHWRPLLRKAVRDRTPLPLDAMLDIARPTHAILLVCSLAFLAASALVWIGGGPGAPAVAASAIVAAQIVYFVAGFAIERPPLRAWLALAAVPWYLAWKSSLTIRALFSVHERTWVKTTRN